MSRIRVVSGKLIYLLALIPLAISMYAGQSVLDAVIIAGYYLILSASWNFLAGIGGQYSFAHVGLATVGAYLTVMLETYGVSAIAAVPLAAVLTTLIGAMLGAVSIRTQGVYLALVTFAFSGAFLVFVTSAYELTGGSAGHAAEFIFEGSKLERYVWTMTAMVVLYYLSQSLVLGSRFGLQIRATAEGETVAEGLGVRTAPVKIAVFAFSSFWAGAAGSILAGYIGLVSPSMGSFEDMGLVIAITVIGGFGSRYGAILGVIVVHVISYYVRGIGGEYTMIVFSGLLIAILFFAKDGLLALFMSLLKRAGPAENRWVAK